jgi:hypothetical protein
VRARVGLGPAATAQLEAARARPRRAPRETREPAAAARNARRLPILNG